MSLSPNQATKRDFDEMAAAGATHSTGNEFTEEEMRVMSARLKRQLTPGETQLKAGKQAYVEGYVVWDMANEVFGYDGWNCSIRELKVVNCAKVGGHWNAIARAIVRVTLKNGTTFHEDMGTGSSKNPVRGAAIEFARKEAVTDARKRAMRQFGSVMGNCLRDKNLQRELVDAKRTPAPQSVVQPMPPNPMPHPKPIQMQPQIQPRQPQMQPHQPQIQHHQPQVQHHQPQIQPRQPVSVPPNQGVQQMPHVQSYLQSHAQSRVQPPIQMYQPAHAQHVQPHAVVQPQAMLPHTMVATGVMSVKPEPPMSQSFDARSTTMRAAAPVDSIVARQRVPIDDISDDVFAAIADDSRQFSQPGPPQFVPAFVAATSLVVTRK